MMNDLNEILIKQIRTQIAQEEQLYKSIQDQIVGSSEAEFEDASEVLLRTSKILESQFTPSNELLDKLENTDLLSRTKLTKSNGEIIKDEIERQKISIEMSRFLVDGYSALNSIATGNSLIHTTALAVQNEEVAMLSLNHLKNLVPLVVQIKDLIPQIIARELIANAPTQSQSIALQALRNIQLAWMYQAPKE